MVFAYVCERKTIFSGEWGERGRIFGPHLKYFIHRNVSSMQSFRNIGIHYLDLNA